jgi:arabinogalactan oligomer/maltooligosaccharide transport system substrate-binding protein
MSSKLHRLLPMVVIGSLVLAACGGGEIGGEESDAPEGSQAPASAAAFPEGDIEIELWTKEGDAQLAFVENLAAAYSEVHPNVTISVVNKDVELLREDMVNTALSPDAQPELLWTVLDHVGPFVDADVIQPLGGMFDESVLAESAQGSGEYEGEIWVAPINIGNQLMLYYNKSIVGEEPPADTDEMIAVAKENTGGDAFGLVFNETESFWLVPWLGGFGGSVFAEDGVTPTLDTDSMKQALQFLYDLKYTEQVMPSECDYNCASGLFTDTDVVDEEGNVVDPADDREPAAMIINGDWELGNYADLLGDDLGVAPIPQVTETGEFPKPYVGGSFYMVPSGVEGDALTVVLDFINFSLAADQQRTLVEELKRLPANEEVLSDPLVTEDPLLEGAGAAVSEGVPQPINTEMRCNFDAMNTAVRDVLGAGNSDIDQVVADMQAAAENCIENL